jgi:Uma2 family endonuclease
MVIRQQTYTVDEVWELAHQPENENRYFELIEGELIEMPPPGGAHGQLASKLARYLGNFADEHNLGVVTVETGYHPPNNRKTLLAPDVAFISKERAPDPFPEQYIPLMPDLAIEIVSPGDSLEKVRKKVAIYLRNGTRLVWIMLPQEKGVDVCRSAEGNRLDIEFVGMDGELDGETILPGFKLKVSDIFSK